MNVIMQKIQRSWAHLAILGFFALAGLLVSAKPAEANSVKFSVLASSGANTFDAYLFRVGDPWPTQTKRFTAIGYTPSGWYASRSFDNVPGNRNYFVRVRRCYDGYTRQTGAQWLGGWSWSSTTFGTLNMTAW